MTSPRYFAIIDPAASGVGAALAARAAEEFKLKVCLSEPRLALLANGETLAAGARRAVVGRAFREHHRLTLETPASGTARDLIDRCWGDYISFSVDASHAAVHVLRSPSGGLAAYRASMGPLSFVASDVHMFLKLGIVRRAIDWTFISHHLAFPHLRGALTGIEGVDELFAGDLTTFEARSTARTCCWSPWQFSGRDASIDDMAEASETVRKAVRGSTAALASEFDRILLELSGGLDSSIVAASLADVPASVSCINLVTPTPEGDERRYARQVASQFCFELVELQAASEIDITAPPHAQLARPGLPGVLRAWEDGFAGEARRRESDVFFGGTGGDNVFCALGSAAPAADILRRQGLGSAFLAASRDVAAVHGATLWSVVRMARALARRPPPDPLWPRVVAFTTEDAMPRAPQFHPWLEEPSGAPPGARSHIRSILAAQAHLDGYARHAVAPSVFPLLAQPVLEACLRVPSWLWVRGGRDRAVARHAFRHDLPNAILDRRTKGMMNAYSTRIFERNRPALRNLLLDGHLASAGLLDREALDPFLSSQEPVKDTAFYRVLELADVEVWARSWLG